jgi:hypothetical protein
MNKRQINLAICIKTGQESTAGDLYDTLPGEARGTHSEYITDLRVLESSGLIGFDGGYVLGSKFTRVGSSTQRVGKE